ncbi:DUF58 domain-containing protein [Halalkalibacter oceani]|uniref:DUF58 domain-containing protein n=1 Tax=Halalkalibacter oceani TaxID=1653776 RepID=UPI0033912312
MTLINTLRPFFKYVSLVVLVGAVFSYAMFQGGFVSWFLFYSVATVLLSTILVALFPFQVKQVERNVSKSSLQAGDDLTVTIVIHKNRFQPFFYVRIQDTVPQRIGSADSAALFFFSFQQKIELTYTVEAAKRGIHSFGPVILVFGDLFGLFERRMVLAHQTDLLVYPRIHRLHAVPASGRPRQQEGTSSRQAIEEDRSLAGVRQYVPGDRLTSIDWKQSARSASLMTKEFESFQGEGIMIAFDPYRNAASAEQFEQTVEFTASLVAEFCKKYQSIELAVRSLEWTSISLSERTVSQGLRLLAQVSSLDKPIEPVHRLFSEWKGMHVYLICVELNQALLAVCRTIQAQQAEVSLCMKGLGNSDRRLIDECKAMGVSVLLFEDE